MNKKRVENILTDLLSTGGELGEVFLENTQSKSYEYIDNRLDKLNISLKKGIGLRLIKENKVYYGSTNDLSKSEIEQLTHKLKSNLKDEPIYKNVTLKRKRKYSHESHNKYSDFEIKAKLKEINDKIRAKEKRIVQVKLVLLNKEQTVTIANQSGLYVTEDRIYSRLFLIIQFKDGEKTSNVTFSKGKCMGNELLDCIDYDTVIQDLIKTGIDKLYAKPCIGQVMPVVIGPGMGAVIIHEACGHSMEAYAVANNLSTLSKKDLNKKIASSKVTVIDDGTLDQEWGSTKIDDEGRKTQKNILIQDGILVNFLIDEQNKHKLDMTPTGSGRRENYTYAPTARMNNTYLEPGNDSVEDMVSSIDLGLYAKSMGGGSVSTETGDFNFSCDTAYMIRNGNIAECVKSATLIGNINEVLQEIEMVGNDFQSASAICGLTSGNIPVTVGQPTIKVGHILVGGKSNE